MIKTMKTKLNGFKEARDWYDRKTTNKEAHVLSREAKFHLEKVLIK